MGDEVVLKSGLRVLVEEFPAQGSKHETLFGILPPHHRGVVVKVEGVGGALEREAAALRHVTALRGPVPALIEVGVGTWRGKRSVCLVMERKAGGSPTTREGWRRMGRALGRLGGPVDRVAGLPVLDHARFGADHAQRIRELGVRLIGVGSVVPDWPLLCSAHIPTPGPLVLTHGDPGPGNFLDDGRDGWLIDWEDAHVAPRGLDLARAIFIARLGSGSAGFVGRDHDARAQEVTAGYTETVPDGWQPTRRQTRWWMAAAGVQFIHHRWQNNGRPGPWQHAAGVLQHILTDTTT